MKRFYTQRNLSCLDILDLKEQLLWLCIFFKQGAMPLPSQNLGIALFLESSLHDQTCRLGGCPLPCIKSVSLLQALPTDFYPKKSSWGNLLQQDRYFNLRSPLSSQVQVCLISRYRILQALIPIHISLRLQSTFAHSVDYWTQVAWYKTILYKRELEAGSFIVDSSRSSWCDRLRSCSLSCKESNTELRRDFW